MALEVRPLQKLPDRAKACWELHALSSQLQRQALLVCTLATNRSVAELTGLDYPWGTLRHCSCSHAYPYSLQSADVCVSVCAHVCMRACVSVRACVFVRARASLCVHFLELNRP